MGRDRRSLRPRQVASALLWPLTFHLHSPSRNRMVGAHAAPQDWAFEAGLLLGLDVRSATPCPGPLACLLALLALLTALCGHREDAGLWSQLCSSLAVLPSANHSASLGCASCWLRSPLSTPEHSGLSGTFPSRVLV